MNIEELIGQLEDVMQEQDNSDATVEVHFQPTYPLKGHIANVRCLNGKVVIAISAGTEYGSKKAWDEQEEMFPCDKCGGMFEDDELCYESDTADKVGTGVICNACDKKSAAAANGVNLVRVTVKRVADGEWAAVYYLNGKRDDDKTYYSGGNDDPCRTDARATAAFMRTEAARNGFSVDPSTNY